MESVGQREAELAAAKQEVHAVMESSQSASQASTGIACGSGPGLGAGVSAEVFGMSIAMLREAIKLCEKHVGDNAVLVRQPHASAHSHTFLTDADTVQQLRVSVDALEQRGSTRGGEGSQQAEPLTTEETYELRDKVQELEAKLKSQVIPCPFPSAQSASLPVLTCEASRDQEASKSADAASSAELQKLRDK
eukprot:3155168-Rhodomonas_salina.1